MMLMLNTIFNANYGTSGYQCHKMYLHEINSQSYFHSFASNITLKPVSPVLQSWLVF